MTAQPHHSGSLGVAVLLKHSSGVWIFPIGYQVWDADDQQLLVVLRTHSKFAYTFARLAPWHGRVPVSAMLEGRDWQGSLNSTALTKLVSVKLTAGKWLWVHTLPLFAHMLCRAARTANAGDDLWSATALPYSTDAHLVGNQAGTSMLQSPRKQR